MLRICSNGSRDVQPGCEGKIQAGLEKSVCRLSVLPLPWGSHSHTLSSATKMQHPGCNVAIHWGSLETQCPGILLGCWHIPKVQTPKKSRFISQVLQRNRNNRMDGWVDGCIDKEET